MQSGGGETAAAPPENGKRMRRPSVRLHQPYYEHPGQRKLQQQWRPTKGVTTPRKPRTTKTHHSKISKNGDANGRGKGDERMHDLDAEDDTAIGSWRNFSAADVDRDFKRKRVRSSNSKGRVPAKSQRIGIQEIGNSALSSGGDGESEEQGQDQDENGVEQEVDLDLVVENSDPSSPYHSIDDDDNVNQLNEDHRNAGGNQVGIQRRSRTNCHPNPIGRESMAREGNEDSSGVRMWLNDLGLRKYTTLFDIHGVDDEVLPLLTLEDLKDMGINEVGVRRKLYSSIQKLEKSFP